VLAGKDGLAGGGTRPATVAHGLRRQHMVGVAS
jgi:hypothetical protein